MNIFLFHQDQLSYIATFLFSSGQLQCRETETPDPEPVTSVKTTSLGHQGANIVLNISLSKHALQGEGPITVTAQTSIPPHPVPPGPNSSAHNNGSSSGTCVVKASSMSSSTSRSNTKPSATFTQSAPTSEQQPLDLVTSPLGRFNNGKLIPTTMPTSSISSLQAAGKSTRPLPGSNGAFFPGLNTSQGGDSPLAKRLRLSSEQAEQAYTSASIMAASLSSASFINDRLRLQLMQAGLSMGDYNLDPHASAGLIDAATSEALRSQILQHYGIKKEPK